MNNNGSVIPVVPSEVRQSQSEEPADEANKQAASASHPSQFFLPNIADSLQQKDSKSSQMSARPRASSEVKTFRDLQLPER